MNNNGYGIFFSSQNYKRTKLIKESICIPELTDPDRNSLSFNLNIQNYLNIFSRFITIPFLFYLYKKKYFENSNAFRDISLILGILGFLTASDYATNELMWRQSQNILSRYGAVSEGYFIDNNKMKNMIEKQAENNRKLKELQEKSKANPKNSDRLYD